MAALNRRNFIRSGAIGIAGLTLAQNSNANTSTKSSLKSEAIITRKLGNTGIELPVISMGVGRCDSPAVVKGAMKMGIRHFDTAHRYQSGNSEKMLGEALKEYDRDSYIIATKVKTTNTAEEFLALFDESLSRLQMDYVDILYLHAISSADDMRNAEITKALKQAKESGKAKHIGVSTHKNEPEVIQEAIDNDLYEIVLTSINFKQEHAAELKNKIALAAENGLGIIGMKVMAGGFMDSEKQVPVNYKAALKWVLKDENVHTTIPSMINLEQLMDNAEVLNNIDLNEEDKKALEVAMNEQGLYCNGCSECVSSCKKQLPIPELMRAYMYAYGYSETKKAKNLINTLSFEDTACSNCTSCTAHCTKDFNLVERISNIERLKTIPSEFLT